MPAPAAQTIQPAAAVATARHSRALFVLLDRAAAGAAFMFSSLLESLLRVC
jgi:hypothetical protein